MRKNLLFVVTFLFLVSSIFAQGPQDGNSNRGPGQQNGRFDNEQSMKSSLTDAQNQAIASMQTQIETLKKSQESIVISATPNWETFISQEKQIDTLQLKIKEIVTLARVEKMKTMSVEERTKMMEKRQLNGNQNQKHHKNNFSNGN